MPACGCRIGLAGALICTTSLPEADVSKPGEEPGLGGFNGCRYSVRFPVELAAPRVGRLVNVPVCAVFCVLEPLPVGD